MKLRIFQLQTNLAFVCALIQKQSKTSNAYLLASGTDHIDINMIHTTTSTNGFLLIYAYFSKYVLFRMRTFQSTYFSYPINRKKSKSTHFSVATAYTVSVVSFENQSESVSSVTFWSGVRCQTYQHHPTSNFSKSLFGSGMSIFSWIRFE